jgi:hypothetical protein
LLLAGFAPFTLLRLVPMVESGAVQQLEGVRHRVQQHALAGPRSAIGYALGHGAPMPLPELAPGTAMAAVPEAPGGESTGTGGRTGTQDPPTTDPSDTGVPMWQGVADAAAPRPAVANEGAGKSGSPPVWGAPLSLPTRSPGRNGTHTVERDDLGPVLRWRPSSPPRVDAPPDGG